MQWRVFCRAYVCVYHYVCGKLYLATKRVIFHDMALFYGKTTTACRSTVQVCCCMRNITHVYVPQVTGNNHEGVLDTGSNFWISAKQMVGRTRCVREGERGKERGGEKERERERERGGGAKRGGGGLTRWSR